MALPITKNIKSIYLVLVIMLTTFISLGLALSTVYINFWPTDSYFAYIPTAAKLFELPYFSEMHNVPAPGTLGRISMHGKESMILGIAIMQKILKDNETLYPNILLLILAVQVSSILIYLIIKKLFDHHIGLIAFFIFATSFWSYQYVLQGAHQPWVMMFFLFTVFFLLKSQDKSIPSLVAGICFGFMLFSSPTATLFLPYFLFVYFLDPFKISLSKTHIKTFMTRALLFLIGCLGIILLFTFPDPLKSVINFIDFLFTSQHVNHFEAYHDYLVKYLPYPYAYNLPEPISFRGAGWIWIIKYFFLIMPLLFSVYLLSILYLFKLSLKQRSLFFLILISLSTPLAVEITQVSQFGRNYYSWFMGIIFLVCFIFQEIKHRFFTNPSRRFKNILRVTIVLLVLSHLIFNLRIFLFDVFPTRMATAKIDTWLAKNNVQKLWVYIHHPNNPFTVSVLNNPKRKHEVQFEGMRTVLQVPEGYILIPPITGRSIWLDCAEDDFMRDPFLTELYLSQNLEKFTVAYFPTLASSKIWTQEEEVCTYRDLILNQIFNQNKRNTYVYILDAKKLHQAWFDTKRP